MSHLNIAFDQYASIGTTLHYILGIRAYRTGKAPCSININISLHLFSIVQKCKLMLMFMEQGRACICFICFLDWK